MPLYEYECEACGQRFEVIQRFADAPAETCRHCGKGPVQRLVSSPAIQFKGSGWYVTDYAGKGKPDAASAEKTTSKSDGKTDESKTRDKSDKKDGTKPDSTSKADSGAKAGTKKTAPPAK